MAKLYIAGATFLFLLLLAFCPYEAAAQPSSDTASLDRWVTVPNATLPVASGRKFDLAFGPDQLPVLAYLDSDTSTLNLKKWDGRAWTSLPGLRFPGEIPTEVRMAYNWAGDIVVGLLSNRIIGGGSSIRVYQLNGSRLGQMGPNFDIPAVSGYAVTIDARGTVVAWLSGGFVVVRRWGGANWTQLGPNVNQSPNTFEEKQSPALAVTGDGKLVVAYTLSDGEVIGIAAAVWNGIGWAVLGDGVPPPSRAVSLGGENSGAPVVAYLNGSSSQVSRWNGSTWAAIGQPCTPRRLGRVFGAPSLTVRGSQPLVVCGIHSNPDTIIGRRMLVARAWSRLSGWEPFGQGTVNGETPLADDNNLAYVIRSDQRGRPWVAWTAKSSANPDIFVSTLAPPVIDPGQ